MQQKYKVAACSCANYQTDTVSYAVDNVLSQLGGIESMIPSGAKVFVKLNLVRDMAPDKCGTTHPEVVVAICNQLLKVTPHVTVGDSCAGLYTKGVLNSVYNKCGITQVEQRTAVKLNQNFDSRSVAIDGDVLPSCDITSSFLDADVVVNVCKLKTHSFACYSGAVKNLYGLIPGLVKVEMHSRYPEIGDFAKLICDIEQFARPKIVLHLMDAVIGMDGEGPTNGNPKFIGQVLASVNAYALDAVAVSLFSKTPYDMPILKEAANRAYVTGDKSDIDFDFDAWQAHFIDDFDNPPVEEVSDFFGGMKMPKWVKKLAKRYLTKSVTMDNSCRGCGKCATHCPAKAITVRGGKAKVKQRKCIRCYCCQELCPFNAVRFKTSLMYKVTHRLSGSKKNK